MSHHRHWQKKRAHSCVRRSTSSLDPENETEIQAAISALVKGRTVIVIAHRLRTVLGADKIAVLENGALVEESA